MSYGRQYNSPSCTLGATARLTESVDDAIVVDVAAERMSL